MAAHPKKAVAKKAVAKKAVAKKAVAKKAATATSTPAAATPAASDTTTGLIKFVNGVKGYGFIAVPGRSDDLYFRLGTAPEAQFLRKGLDVEFDVQVASDGRDVATNVRLMHASDAKVNTAAGRVKFWDGDKGFGFVVSDGQDLYLSRRSTLFDGGVVPGEGDSVKVEYVDTGEKTPIVVKLQITELAPWKPSGIPLFDYADIGSRAALVDQLANLAEREPWDNQREPTGGKPILDSYLRYTFVRLQDEEKICATEDGRYSVFNTGLVTPMQEEIFAFFSKNPTDGRQPWQFVGFRKRSDRTLLQHFGHRLPDLANYFDDPGVLLYDRRLPLHINIDHVLEHLERFPEPLNANEFLARQAIQAAELNTRNRVYRNYKAAIPQWYRDHHAPHASVQLLLPLCLRQPDKADLALVVARIGDSYRGNTVLTLDMAYRNARLLARPDSDWLVP